jgi:hypothetical protein
LYFREEISYGLHRKTISVEYPFSACCQVEYPHPTSDRVIFGEKDGLGRPHTEKWKSKSKG